MFIHKIRIVADTSTDLTFADAQRLGVELLPIPVFVDGIQRRDGIDFSHESFYEILEKSKKLPSTSHISLSTASEVYERAYAEGCEAVVHICNYSGTSGAFNSARLAKQNFFEEHPEAEGKIRIEPIDSKGFSMIYGMSVVAASEMRASGATVDAILAKVDEIVNRAQAVLCMYDLKYAKNSGRISAAAAFAGSVLGIRPIIGMADGGTEPIDKVRGDKILIPRIVDEVEKLIGDDKVYYVAGGYDIPEIGQLSSALEKKLGAPPTGHFKLGCSVAINVGPKTLGIIFLGKDRRV